MKASRFGGCEPTIPPPLAEVSAGSPRRKVALLGAFAALALGEATGRGRTQPARAQGSISLNAEASPPALKSAVFSAGDARLLQPAFEDIRYKGITSIEVGRVADGTRAVRVTYDPKRCNYKALLGAYWRNIDPTDEDGQFDNRGSAFRSVIWVSDEIERELASKSSKLMETSGVYGPTVERGYLKGGVDGRRRIIPFVTEISEGGTFSPTPEDGQDFYKLKPQEYKELRVKSGRERFFKDHYTPVNTTECIGSVCGFVYFPCTQENRCMDVTTGDW